MLKNLLVVSLAVLVLVSCKKDNAESQRAFHLSAKIDGVKVDFSPSLAAEIYFDPQNGHTFSVLGIGGTSGPAVPVLDLMIHDDTEITTKTYTLPQNELSSSYTDVNNEDYYSDTEFSITITFLTATEVKGTFTGKFYQAGTNNIVNVTEGSFYSRVI